MQDSFAIPGTESQQAIDRLAAVFPQTAGASAQLVIHSDGASSTAGPLHDRDRVGRDRARRRPGRRERGLAVRRVPVQAVSEDGKHGDRAGAVRRPERRGHRRDARRRAGDRVDPRGLGPHRRVRRAGLPAGRVRHHDHRGLRRAVRRRRAHRHLRLAARGRPAAADRAIRRSAARWAPCSPRRPSRRSPPRRRCSHS